MLGLPVRIRHAVDKGASVFLGHRACFGNPIAKAIAAKSGQTHQINILGIGAMLKMRDKPPKCCRRRSVIKYIYIHNRRAS
jgi:hypothetical protein